MKLLLDTRLLVLAASQPDRLSATAQRLIRDPDNHLFFSVASLWEVAVKNAVGHAHLLVDAQRLRRGLIDNGYEEVEITGEHAASLASLQQRGGDPFDRMLVAQAIVEGLTILTADPALTGPPGAIRYV